MEFITNIWSSITDFIEKIQSIINDLYNLFIALVNFFPTPFKEILLSFGAVLLIVIIFRILRKG